MWYEAAAAIKTYSDKTACFVLANNMDPDQTWVHIVYMQGKIKLLLERKIASEVQHKK